MITDINIQGNRATITWNAVPRASVYDFEIARTTYQSGYDSSTYRFRRITDTSYTEQNFIVSEPGYYTIQITAVNEQYIYRESAYITRAIYIDAPGLSDADINAVQTPIITEVRPLTRNLYVRWKPRVGEGVATNILQFLREQTPGVFDFMVFDERNSPPSESSHVYNNLPPATLYYPDLFEPLEDGVSRSPLFFFVTRLDTPVIQRAEVNGNEISLSWARPRGVDTFGVQIYKGTSLFSEELVDTGESISGNSYTATIDSITPGTYYRINVIAFDSVDLYYPESEIATAIVYTQAETVARPTRDQFTISGETVSGVTINWGATPTLATNYRISISPDDGNSGIQEVDATTAGSRAFSGLMPNTAYMLTIIAFDGATRLESEALQISARTAQLPQLGQTTITPSIENEVDLTVRWNSVTNATGYGVSLYLEGSSTLALPSVPISGNLAHTFTGLKPETRYRVEVRAQAVNYRDSITTISAETESALAETASNPTADQITLRWTAIPGAQDYEVKVFEGIPTNEEAVFSGNFAFTRAITIVGTQTTISDLDPGTPYTIYIVARGSDGSAIQVIKPQAPVVTDETPLPRVDSPTFNDVLPLPNGFYVSWLPTASANHRIQLFEYDKSIAAAVPVDIKDIEVPIVNVVVDAPRNSYLFTELSPSLSKAYILTLITISNESSRTDSSAIHWPIFFPLKAPTIKQVSITNAQATITWEEVAGAGGYRLLIDKMSLDGSVSERLEDEVIGTEQTNYTSQVQLSAEDDIYYAISVRAIPFSIIDANSAYATTAIYTRSGEFQPGEQVLPNIDSILPLPKGAYVSWTPANSDPHRVTIGLGSATTVVEVEAPQDTHLFTDLSETTSYSLSITALNNASDTSDDMRGTGYMSFIELERPVINSVTTEESSITIEWSAVPKATGYFYSVYELTSHFASRQVGDGFTTGTEATIPIPSLTRGTGYRVWVTAFDGVNFSRGTTLIAVSGTPLPRLPAPRTQAQFSTDAMGTTLAVTWEPNDNADGYQIILYRGDSIEYVILSSTIIDASEASEEYYDLDPEGTYTISVVALGSASQNSDSIQAFRAIVQGLRLRLKVFLEGPLQ